MRQSNYLFTSESVTEGHPDKVADQISDAVLDSILADDPAARVACETLVTTGLAVVAGEITTATYVDIPKVVRNVVHEIGYDNPEEGFDWRTCAVLTAIGTQSPDIAMGVNEVASHEQGAGDQGLMTGFACNQTPELMPMPIQLAHQLTRRLAQARRAGDLTFLRPDGKSQVTVRYEGGKPVRVEAVVVSTQHADIPMEQIREGVMEEIVKKVIPAALLGPWTQYFINPTGRFVVGGPKGDTGLTGRKIIVDTYGGYTPHGGGAFSGKDPSKVNRSATYMARHIAKNIVAAELADECEVQLAYAIGVADPVSVLVDTHGTGRVIDTRLEAAVREVFPLKPRGIIEYLDLRRPIYRKTASYGHFGRNEPEFTWEATNQSGRLRDLLA